MIASLPLYPGAVDYPATNPATPTFGSGRSVLTFGASANQTILLPFVMPQAYEGGALELVVHCVAEATTGDVDLDASLEAVTPDAGESVLSDSFDTVNSSDNNSVPSTVGHLFSITISLTNDDGVAAGDECRIRLTRDQASDTLAANLHVLSVELRES